MDFKNAVEAVEILDEAGSAVNASARYHEARDVILKAIIATASLSPSQPGPGQVDVWTPPESGELEYHLRKAVDTLVQSSEAQSYETQRELVEKAQGYLADMVASLKLLISSGAVKP